jgi:xanthine dehydrogenase accessory factor
MSDSLLDLAYTLIHAEEPFVLATVVRCERPTSAKPGAQAIIQRNGQITGWIGGSCAQPIVVREALRILREGDDPYLLRLGSSINDAQQSEIRSFPMTCVSGGVLDIFMEPHLPLAQLVLIGDSPVLAALRQMAPVLHFRVTQIDHVDLSTIAINERTSIVISTHGHYDEDALVQALQTTAVYVGMVASHRRADTCRAYLRSLGLPEHVIARFKAPAGLDIGAVTPEEIASSILAELIQVRRRGAQEETHEAHAELHVAMHVVEVETAIDPICGMTVEIATTRHKTSYDGREFYFCCPACKRQFERNPQEHVLHSES